MVRNPKFHTWYVGDSRHDEFQADKQKHWKARKFDGVNEESNAYSIIWNAYKGWRQVTEENTKLQAWQRV